MTDRKRNRVPLANDVAGDKRIDEIDDPDEPEEMQEVSEPRKNYFVEPGRVIRLFATVGFKAEAQKNVMALGFLSRPVMVPAMFKLALGIKETFLPLHTLLECAYLIRTYNIMYYNDPTKVVDPKSFRLISSVTKPVEENDFLTTRAPVREGEMLPADERSCFYHEMHVARVTYMQEADAALKAEDPDVRVTLFINANERFYYKMLYLDEQCSRRRLGLPLDAPSVRIEVMRSQSGRVPASHIRAGSTWPITLGYIRSPDPAVDAPTLHEITFLPLQREDCDKFNSIMREWEIRNGFEGTSSLPAVEHQSINGESAPNGGVQ